MQNYIDQISKLNNPSFQEIRRVAENSISHISDPEKVKLWRQLNRGVGLLDSHETLCQYLYSYGNMHQAKLLNAFKKLPDDLLSKPFEITDWGCGQAMGTINLFDYLTEKGYRKNIRKVTLVEPSKAALERGVVHTLAYVNNEVKVESINDFFENVTPEQITSEGDLPQVHLFSNILDVAQIDLKHLSQLIDSSVISDSYLVCVGPLNPTNRRIDAFLRYFDEYSMEKLYEYESYNFKEEHMSSNNTCKVRIYKLEPNRDGHLIPIEYYPTVQFQAAYELDAIGALRKSKALEFNELLTHFEVAAPFDLGASIYDDVHPILAVANNIITRGLPTKASLFIEEKMEEAFGLTSRTVTYGEIRYLQKETVNLTGLDKLFVSALDNASDISPELARKLQLLLTPVAVARFQKVLLEAIITGRLPLGEERWKILVEENDVPFAALAIKDLENLIENLARLSEDYQNAKLPEMEVTIIGNKNFVDSPLHLGLSVITEVVKTVQKPKYDLVVSQAVLKRVSEAIETFSKFKCKNNCYFNIRTITAQRTDRIIYTSDRIRYKSLVEKDTQGNYIELKETKANLTYFLQLLFRKESFRPGQLPILDRALKNQPVIGLLPTGGGKSLTYQIAALLQPGVTLVIDPLKSLMKDQYDGLINSGIDNAAYINGSLTAQERKIRENQLESSQLIFVFLSPERLSIASFRERLKNMHDHNVYFSYGVIDEVHCVSEWGHDFRFSYLHLGRNLYNYVKAKSGVISLFGLTATASFDVLADVERELSGSGSFNLDADAIIRYENTNRLELQYKIEKVPVHFDEDRYYDNQKMMPPHLPKALNITNHWPQFESKSNFLIDYIDAIPAHIRELQKGKNIKLIKSRFAERQNNNEGIDESLLIEMPDHFHAENTIYNQAGIVFCPHVNSTGLSVNVNSTRFKNKKIAHVGSFSGKDDDEKSMANMEQFRDNKQPLMVATKAFGMGIDKPNVRFTINMNYSSSLEAFVQEAGRSGRDRKLSLATILLSDYNLVKINKECQKQDFPISIIKNKWFYKKDLDKILKEYHLSIPEEELMYATPSSDIVKLHCTKNNVMFAFNRCSADCDEHKRCILRKVTPNSKGWKTEKELLTELQTQNLKLSRKHFQYLSADYQSVMYFFNESFKGDIIEKTNMNKILNQIEVEFQTSNSPISIEKQNGFLNSLKKLDVGEEAVVFISYSSEDYSDLSKAIYRMCCIDLIVDFTQDYVQQKFKIIVSRKAREGYFEGLRQFLLRYYTSDRAEIELYKAKQYPVKQEESDITEEIYKCLAYLTEFVYDKISEKRKRAIDDMRTFCIEGLNGNGNWIDSNERLKDFLYYYFNSKYAKTDYIAENGEPFSLVEDTDGGKKSDIGTLFKYLRVIDDDVVGVGTPLDNIKHLYGAVRLISRSLTDSNPALSLLDAFCLAYMGTKRNPNLETQLYTKYSEGMIEAANRANSPFIFWEMFDKYNDILSKYLVSDKLQQMKEETMIMIHGNQIKELTLKYTK